MGPIAAAAATGAIMFIGTHARHQWRIKTVGNGTETPYLKGLWERSDKPGMQEAIGVAGVAVGLSILQRFDKDLASAFGTLIVLGGAMFYGRYIALATGLIENA